MRREIRKDDKGGAATEKAQTAQTAPAHVKTVELGEVSGQTAAAFGIREDDQLELEAADAPQPGEVLLLFHDRGFMVGRFVRFDDERDGRKIVLDKADGQWSYPTAGLRIFRPLRISRRFGAPEPPAEGSGLSPEAQCRIEELRRRLGRLTSNDEESERFRVEREIYDLTHAPACAEDEWPDVVSA